MEENTRLTDLTRMLLSSPSFSGFLDTLAQNPAALHQQPQPTSAPQQGENRQQRKDVNAYVAQQQMQNQQIGVAMIPEQHMDFTMLDLNNDNFSYQPQVFSLFSIPETPIDSEVLSGKHSAPSHDLSSVDEKVELPTVERAPEFTPGKVEVKEIEAVVVDEEFDADPLFALFAAAPAPTPAPISKPANIETVAELLALIPAKQEHFSLVVESRVPNDEAQAAIRKVDRICAGIEQMADRLRSLTLSLE
jgi:bZIP-type transcription factor MBZ1